MVKNKRKSVVGLVAIVAIVVMVMFTGCIEEEAPVSTPTPSPTPITTVTPSPSPSFTPSGLGTGGECVCPSCGYTMPHQRNVKCNEQTCPKCGAKMIRQDGQAGMANPASVYCKEQGGELRIEKDANGGEIGICTLPDGTECEEWAFYRGECPFSAEYLESKAKEFCGKENVDSVYICGEYIKVVSSLIGGGSTFYKLDPTGSLVKEAQCPVVAPDAMSEKCKLMFGLNCVEPKVC